MHNLIDLSFVFMNKIGAPQGEVIGLMNPLFNRPCNCSFNSFGSIGAIRYRSIDIGCVLITKLISKSISLRGGSSGRSSKNTSGSFLTAWIDFSPGNHCLGIFDKCPKSLDNFCLAFVLHL